MKAVVIGVGAGKSMEEIMAVYPRHKAVDDFETAGATHSQRGI